MIRAELKLQADLQIVLQGAFEHAGESLGVLENGEWQYVAFKNSTNRSHFITYFLEYVQTKRLSIRHYLERIPKLYRKRDSWSLYKESFAFISLRLDAFLTANEEKATLEKFSKEEVKYIVKQVSGHVKGEVDISKEEATPTGKLNFVLRSSIALDLEESYQKAARKCGIDIPKKARYAALSTKKWRTVFMETFEKEIRKYFAALESKIEKIHTENPKELIAKMSNNVVDVVTDGLEKMQQKFKYDFFVDTAVPRIVANIEVGLTKDVTVFDDKILW